MEQILSVMVGIGLSAACGFRVFVPLLVMSIAARSGHLALSESFTWIASWPALLAFSLATLLEIAAYYVPWVDNLLDGLASPAAVVAGVVVTAACITDLSPFLKWSLGVIAGGGAAGTVQALTVTARAGSSTTTGGMGNPILATLEAGLSAFMALLSLVLPILAMVLLVGVLFMLVRWWMRRRRPSSEGFPA